MIHGLLHTKAEIIFITITQFDCLKSSRTCTGRDRLSRRDLLPVVSVSAVTSTSTVGFPLESNICLACTSVILIFNDIKKFPFHTIFFRSMCNRGIIYNFFTVK